MDRHRKYQVTITCGVVVTTFAALLVPEFAHYAAAGSVFTNILWIWER